MADGSCNQHKAQQQFEQQMHLRQPGLFGPAAPRVTQQQVLECHVHALLANQSKTPGFSQLLTLMETSSEGGQEQQQAFNSPLLRLLRRVAHWWYYDVMFAPLDQLLQLSSNYELLFQLLTPHQQLSCMADILLLLACPVLGDDW